MTLARWDPFGDLTHVRRLMDRLWEEPLRPLSLLRAELEGGLALDMYQAPDRVVVKATLPGAKPEDVEITITGDTLNIKGETRFEEEVKREDYLVQERRYGSFSRTVLLPGGLKTDAAEATFENGVLTLTIPKAEEAKKKTIKVKAATKEAKKVEARKG